MALDNDLHTVTAGILSFFIMKASYFSICHCDQPNPPKILLS